jgi:hypothetical protein
MKLTIHIIVVNKVNFMDRQNIFVALEGLSRIRRFRNILSSQTNEKAMMFALSRGRVIDPSQANGSTHVILTRDGVHWDLT